MNKISFSDLDDHTKSILENLHRLIPAQHNGLTEVVWLFTNTNKTGRLSIDPATIKKLYPTDKYFLTVLIPSSSLVQREFADIQPYFIGFRVFEINDLNFLNILQSRFNKNYETKVDDRLFIFFENKLFVSDKMLELFLEEDLIDYQKKDDLKVVSISNGIIHPLELSKTNKIEDCQYGGVTDANLNFVELSATLRTEGRHHQTNLAQKWYIGANPNNLYENIEFINEEVVFIGPLKKHFGHFILEGLARLWFFLDPNNLKYKAVYLSEPGEDKFNEFFELFGLKPENLIKIYKPTAFKRVFVPEQSFSIQDQYHQKYKETIDQITLQVTPAIYKKVYFSKEFAYNIHGLGGKLIDQIFAENGYQVFYPEQLSISDMIAVLKGCEIFAAASGTNAHHAIFLSDNATSICINRSPHIHYIQTMIDRMKGLDSYYIEANVSLLPVSWSAGPFLVGPTKYLFSYLNYFEFTYDAQVLYDEFPKYMISFLKAWGLYYNDEDRKTWIDSTERILLFDEIVGRAVDTFSHMHPDMANRSQPLNQAQISVEKYSGDLPSNDFVMFCKTFHGDIERVQILVETFNQFNQDKIKLYISAPAAELRLFAPMASETIEVISDESYADAFLTDKELASGMRAGYANQQICKLTFYLTGFATNYLTLDSDSIFIRDFYISDFMYDYGIPYTVLVQDKDLSIERHYRNVHWVTRQEYISKIYTYMELNDKRLRTCHNTQVLNALVLDSLKNDFMKSRNLSYIELLNISPYEFTWYNVWFQKCRIIQEVTIEPFFKMLHMRPEYIFSRLKGLREEDYAHAYVGLVMNSKWHPPTPLRYENPKVAHLTIYNSITTNETMIDSIANYLNN